MQSYAFDYQILYYKLANKEKARNYFFKTNKYESEIFVFEPTLVNKEYLDMIFQNIPKSIYSFIEEDLQLTKNFQLNSNYENRKQIFDWVLQETLELKDEEAKVKFIIKPGHFTAICVQF